jgi:hypothetical protein
LLDRTKHPDAPIWLLSKYPDHHRGPSRAVALAEGQAIRAASSLIERSNLARHAMAVDVDKRGHPVYFNPMSIYWKGVPEIAVMHRAFGVALKLLSRYAVIQEALTKSDATLVSILEFLFLQLKTYNLALRFQDDMMAKEEPAIEELLLSLGQ